MTAKQILTTVWLTLSLILIQIILAIPQPTMIVAAQSTGDSITLSTATAVPVATVTSPVTNTPQPTLTPTPLGQELWEGRVAKETLGIGMASARLIVRVVGRTNQAIRLSTLAQVINQANTGQKPELGPDMVEFAGLTPGHYIIEPRGLNTRFDVELKSNTETVVEFSPALPPPTATLTDTPPPFALPTYTRTATPTPSFTPTPTDTPTITPTTTPLPSPTPMTKWLGIVEKRQQTTQPASIMVKAFGIEGLPISLKSNTVDAQRCITGQVVDHRDSCLFENLSAGLYTIIPESLGINLPLLLAPNEQVTIIFDIEVLPAGVIGWQAYIHQNSNGIQATNKTESIITALVNGRSGQVVALHSARQPDQFCEIASNPLTGLGCEFSQLEAGVYTVEALNTGASTNLFVDGSGKAEIEFVADARQIATPSLPLVGHGAHPRLPTSTPFVESVPTSSVSTKPTPTQTARPYYPPTPTETLTPTITPTATPAFAWQARVVEATNNVAGTVGVRAAGLKDHPVVLRSGGWESEPLLTGTKPELGEYGAEFGGLAQGEYEAELVGLAKFKFFLEGDQYLLIEFRYDFINPP
jgi:hypothetical protein